MGVEIKNVDSYYLQAGAIVLGGAIYGALVVGRYLLRKAGKLGGAVCASHVGIREGGVGDMRSVCCSWRRGAGVRRGEVVGLDRQARGWVGVPMCGWGGRGAAPVAEGRCRPRRVDAYQTTEDVPYETPLRQQVLMDAGSPEAHAGVHVASTVPARLIAAAAILRTRPVLTAMVVDIGTGHRSQVERPTSRSKVQVVDLLGTWYSALCKQNASHTPLGLCTRLFNRARQRAS